MLEVKHCRALHLGPKSTKSRLHRLSIFPMKVTSRVSPYWFKLVPTVHPQYGQVHRRKPKTTPKRGRRRRRTTSDPIAAENSCHSCHSFCQVQSPELLLFNWLNRDQCDTLWPYIPLHMASHMALHFTTLGSSGVIWGRRCDWNIVPW